MNIGRIINETKEFKITVQYSSEGKKIRVYLPQYCEDVVIINNASREEAIKALDKLIEEALQTIYFLKK